MRGKSRRLTRKRKKKQEKSGDSSVLRRHTIRHVARVWYVAKCRDNSLERCQCLKSVDCRGEGRIRNRSNSYNDGGSNCGRSSSTCRAHASHASETPPAATPATIAIASNRRKYECGKIRSFWCRALLETVPKSSHGSHR